MTRRMDWVCLVVVFVMVAVSSRDVFLFGDDYAFLGQARRSPFDLDYLRADLFGHFSPVSRTVDYVAANTFAGSPAAEPVILLTIVASTQVCILYLFHVCVPHRIVALAGGFLACTSVTLVSLAHWWTAGLNILPGVAGGALCLAGSVTAVRDHSRRGAALALTGYVIGGLSWELSLLMPLYVVAYAVLFVWPPSVRPVAQEVRRTLFLWVGLVLVGAAFAVNYVSLYLVPLPKAPLWEYVVGLYVSFVVTVVPATVGVFEPSDGPVIVSGRVVLLAVLGLTVRATLRGRDGAARAWLFALLGWFLPSAVLVASRVGVHGPWVATLPFYFLLPVVLSTLGVAIAVYPTVERALGRRVDRTSGSDVPASPRVSRRGVALGSLVGIAFLAVWVPSAAASGTAITTFSATIQEVAPPTGAYVANLRSSAAALSASSRPASVINGDVPHGLVAEAYAPYNRLDWVASVNGIPLDVDRYGRDQYVADEEGRLRRAVQEVRYTHTFRASDVALVENAAAVSFTASDGLCFIATSASSSLRLVLPQLVYGSNLVLTTELSVDRPTSRRIIGAAFVTGSLDVVSYDDRRWRPGMQGAVDTVRFPWLGLVSYDSFTPGTRVCLRSVQVAQVTPAS